MVNRIVMPPEPLPAVRAFLEPSCELVNQPEVATVPEAELQLRPSTIIADPIHIMPPAMHAVFPAACVGLTSEPPAFNSP